MKRNIKNILKYIVVFVITISILITLLIFGSSVKKKDIKDNLNQSVKYVNNKELLFGDIIKNNEGTKYDLYADTIILNIIASQDDDNIVKSVFYSKYYDDVKIFPFDDLDYIIKHDSSKANQEYVRYWHGSIAIVKPLLLFFDLGQIYIFNYIVMGLLFLVLLYLIFKRSKLLSAITLISFVLTYSFFVPNCLEYTWCFYIAILTSIFALIFEKKHPKLLNYLFLISGITTCFFDFLTVETLPLLLPLTLILIIRYNEKRVSNFKETFSFSFKCCLLFGLGYIFSWLAKWSLASVILNINAFSLSFGKAGTRIYGKVENNLFIQSYFGILKNISNLLIFSIFYRFKDIAVYVFGFFMAAFFYLFRKSKKKLWFVKILFLIFLIPIIRFILMSNHSFVHSFFTYRALIPSIICLIYIFIIGIDKKLFNFKKK